MDPLLVTKMDRVVCAIRCYLHAQDVMPLNATRIHALGVIGDELRSSIIALDKHMGSGPPFDASSAIEYLVKAAQ